MPPSSCLTLLATATIALAAIGISPAAPQTIDPDFHHLRNAEPREWDHFPENAEAAGLELSFDLSSPEKPKSLILRQANVKGVWKVTLNDKLLGSLNRDHNDLEQAFALPEGLLKEKGKHLATTKDREVSDDIRVGEVALYELPLAELARESYLEIAVRDIDQGIPLPCRITIVNAESGTLPVLGARSSDRLAVRSGVVYTLDGRARVGLRPGDYTVYAGRGFEYSLAEQALSISAGEEKEIALELRREVETPGLVACDTHLHTLEFAKHGDASLIERLITLAGEGIELPISTEHNQHIGYAPEAARIGADRFYTPVLGCEVTTSEGHFNCFPIEPGTTPVETKLRPWPRIFRSIFEMPNVKVAILNHPRDLHRKFRPFDPSIFDAERGLFTDGRVLEANGVELINSGAHQSDPMQVVRDWFALLRSGHRIAGVGCSDSHTVNFAIAGQARTYLPAPDQDPSNIDVDTALASFVAGDTNVSFGLLALLDLEEGNRLRARVLGPGWTRADRLVLYADGEPVREIPIPPEAAIRPGEKFSASWSLDDLGAGKNAFFVAIAEGPGIVSPWWPMMPPYQADSSEFRPYVMGISRALRIP
ncbi:MAG: hypothetical protein ACC661_06425 [Verrucomicrobiales bacterium]